MFFTDSSQSKSVEWIE